MLQLPIYIPLLFGIALLLTGWFFYKASGYSKPVLILFSFWLLVQSVVGISGFYTITDTKPPRFLLLVLPSFVLIFVLFITRTGRQFINPLNLKMLTLLHSVRIIVELVLYLLFLHKAVPQLMTFEGRNFDILAGLSAPLVYFLAFRSGSYNRMLLLVWNLLCLGLLINIVVNAVFSAPFPFQKFAFDQPNIAVLYFPFSLLPGFIVPVVLFSHLVVIRKMIINESKV